MITLAYFKHLKVDIQISIPYKRTLTLIFLIFNNKNMFLENKKKILVGNRVEKFVMKCIKNKILEIKFAHLFQNIYL